MTFIERAKNWAEENRNVKRCSNTFISEALYFWDNLLFEIREMNNACFNSTELDFIAEAKKGLLKNQSRGQKKKDIRFVKEAQQTIKNLLFLIEQHQE